MIEALADLLRDEQEAEITKTAVAGALVELDADQYAELLFRQSQQGQQMMKLIVEPALMRWDYQPVRETWLQRLQALPGDRALLDVAVEQLGRTGDQRASAGLGKLALDEAVAPTLRIAAARSLARCIRDAQQAAQWSEQMWQQRENGPANPIVGALLLSGQDSPQAIELLQRYALSDVTTAAAIAIERLNQVAVDKVVAHAEQLLSSRDSSVRGLAIAALQSSRTPQTVELLFPLLNDPVPSIRQAARRVLMETSAEQELRSLINQKAAQLIHGDAWKATEQALLILAELEYRDEFEQMMVLIDDPHPGVQITAAWAIKTLATEAWMAKIFSSCERIGTQEAKKFDPNRTQTLIHLIETLGKMNETAAEEFLQLFIPKNAPYTPECRAAAIWSLGKLKAGSEDQEMSRTLGARLVDTESTPPEFRAVRTASAVAMGRIKSAGALDALRARETRDGPGDFVGRRCAWAIEQIEGTPMPPLVSNKDVMAGWFLQPLD